MLMEDSRAYRSRSGRARGEMNIIYNKLGIEERRGYVAWSAPVYSDSGTWRALLGTRSTSIHREEILGMSSDSWSVFT